MIIKSMKVGRIEDQGDRVLLYQSAEPVDDLLGEFHIITSRERGVQVGDVVTYEPYGINFGFLA